MTVSGHLIGVSLMNPNACSHPAIMYGQWVGWNGTPLDQPPMFYTGVTEETGELLTKMSEEVVHLGKVIAEKSGADMSQVDVILILALFSSSIFLHFTVTESRTNESDVSIVTAGSAI